MNASENRALSTSTAQATDVVAHDVTPLTVNTDAGAYSKIGWLVVLLGVGGFLLWASLAPLDKGVPLPGTVVVASNRKAIQHLGGGIVDDILVQDGDVVKAGQVLVRMNKVQVASAAEITRGLYYSSRAAEARLLAERDGKPDVTFPADLLAARKDPRAASSMDLQQQLFSSRKAALRDELSAMDENVAGLDMQTKGLEESRDSKKEQMGILKEQLGNTRELAKEGYVARAKLMDLERTYSQINGALSEDIGNIGRGQRQIVQLKLQRSQRQQEFQRDLRAQLADVQKDVEQLSSKMVAQDYDLANAEVRAPVDGTVLGMAVFTRGGVVSPGFRMMDVVPSDDPLIVEGQLPVNLIDKIHAGLKVELIFSAFNANKTPHIPGEVTEIAADRTVEEKTGQPFYKVRVKVAPEGKKLVANLQIRPGMPVEMFVKTGERTMMSYLLKPVFDRAKSSMAED
jgi:protease secretion system membrane fusion protein